jgi:ribosomal protein S18 acetylase RimI-like enzyme
MHTEFRKVDAQQEMRSLLAFDRKIFRAADRFPAEYWTACESYWMLAGRVKVGCCAFQRHVDFADDLREDGVNPRRKGSLYISTTGILPRYQRMGFGQLMKSWQVAFARFHGFSRVVTNTREGNAAMIAINRKFGFEIVRTTPRYYRAPAEATAVMELVLSR